MNGLDPSLVGQNIFNSLPPEHQQTLLSYVGNSVLFRAPKADRNNFAPRVGLAWDVFGDGRTSVRAGGGIAYDVLYGNLATLQLPPQFQAENRETNACLLSPSPAWCALVPPGGSPLNAPIRASTTGFIEGGALLNVLPTDALTNQAARAPRPRRLSRMKRFPKPTPGRCQSNISWRRTTWSRCGTWGPRQFTCRCSAG